MNNPPAFPQPITKDVHGNIISANDKWFGDAGMTLRDYFMAHETLSDFDNPDAQMPRYLYELLAGEKMPEGGWNNNPIEYMKWEAKWRAALKGIRADAMLAERASQLTAEKLT